MATEYRLSYTAEEIDNRLKKVETIDEKQDKFSGVQGQVVGFDNNGNAVAQDMPKINVDNTLTQEGQAADAKAVGDTIKDLSANLAYIDAEDNENVENLDSVIVIDSTLTMAGQAADAKAVGDLKQDKLTGTAGQVVGFDENGAAISQNLTPKSIGAQPERMVVTVSKIYGSDNENDSYISDYTSSQIIDAHRNGIDVIVYAAFLYEYLYFNGVVHIVNGVLFVGNGGTHSILIRNDGTAEYYKKLYQPKITGTAGQVVGFDENGNTVAQDAPSGSSSDLVVTFSMSSIAVSADTGDMSIISFSHTYDEIVAAYNEGRQVLVVFDDDTAHGVFYLTSVEADEVHFIGGGFYNIFNKPVLHLSVYKNAKNGYAGILLCPANIVNEYEFNEGLSSKQDKITGTQGQIVGFDENGNAVAQDAPSGGSSDLVVTFSINGATTSASTGNISIPSFSHTYDEIVTAYNEGKQVLAICDDDTNHGVFYLTSIETDEVHFIGGGFYSHRDKPVLHLSIYKNAKNGYAGILLCPANIVNEYEFNEGLSSKQDKITGTAGDFVVIGTDGNATTTSGIGTVESWVFTLEDGSTVTKKVVLE